MTTASPAAAHRSPCRAPRRGGALALALALGAGVGLSACSSRDTAVGTAASSAAASRPPTATAKPKATAAKTSSAPPTTSALGVFPPVLSSSPSPVAAASIRSIADLPAAFLCPDTPAPISIPASTKGPANVVCTSKLAGEALFLWFVDSPDARYLALQAAMATAKNVHGGPTWVAGGMIDPAMGSIGGDVYKTTPAS